jgi:thioredoxin reductase
MAGFIIVDGRGETDLPGLFAAGDVTSTPLRSIATSVGDGTRAARTIAELLQVWT